MSFNLEQAEEIVEDFEDLLDTDVKVENGSYLTVTHVAIAPNYEQDKNAFAEQVISQNASPIDLLEGYSTEAYDVIIIAQDPDDNSVYEIIDIRSYIDKNGIQYNFPA